MPYLLPSLLAIITSVAGLRDALRNNAPSKNYYSITGTVTAATGDLNCILTDGRDFCYVRAPVGTSQIQVGDIVRAKGRIAGESHGGRVPYSKRMTVIGHSATLPPVLDITSDKLEDPEYEYRTVRATGHVVDIADDDIDPQVKAIILRDGLRTFRATIGARMLAGSGRSFVDADVSVTGPLMMPFTGVRHFLQPAISILAIGDIAILKPAPADPFDVPAISTDHHIPLSAAFGVGRRRANGQVLAVWEPRRILLRTDARQTVVADLVRDSSVPCVGTSVTVAGFPTTDLFNVNLTRAICREIQPVHVAPSPVTNVTATVLFTDERGQRRINTKLHGQAVRVRGKVSNAPLATDNGWQLQLHDGGLVVSVNVDSCRAEAAAIAEGSVVEATGVCVLDAANWQPTDILPQVNGLVVVTRSADDLTVVSVPPWWTPERLLVVIGALLAALVGIVAWNRVLRRMIERKGRELFRTEIDKAESDLRIDERTRLAVELHDNIAQTLTGVSFQIDAAEKTLREDTDATAGYLGVARRTLLSCREELRRCLWDLRSHTIEDANLTDAIRKTVRPHAGAAEVSVRFNVPRDQLSDSTTHAILCIVRELTVNAVRHGQAAHVRIAGERRDGRIRFSVTDDGRGFDPSNRPGPSEGHFGLQGIRERVNRLNGTLAVRSAPGKGCKTVVELN